MQSTNLQQLKIRKMTKAQYDTITPQTGEIDFVVDAGLPDGTTIAFNTNMNFEAVGTNNTNTAHTFYAWRQEFDVTKVFYTTVPYDTSVTGFKVYDSNFKEVINDSIDENEFYQDKMWYYDEEGTGYVCSRSQSEDIVFNPVKQWIGTREQYDAIATKDLSTYYTLVDEGKVYLGEVQLGDGTGGGGSSGNCLPSSTYTSLTLGSSGATYTAPADGWYSVKDNAPFGDYGSASHILIINQTLGTFSSGVAGNLTAVSAAYLPVRQSDVVQVYYMASGAGFTFRFYYTQSSAPSS